MHFFFFMCQGLWLKISGKSETAFDSIIHTCIFLTPTLLFFLWMNKFSPSWWRLPAQTWPSQVWLADWWESNCCRGWQMSGGCSQNCCVLNLFMIRKQRGEKTDRLQDLKLRIFRTIGIKIERIYLSYL